MLLKLLNQYTEQVSWVAHNRLQYFLVNIYFLFLISVRIFLMESILSDSNTCNRYLIDPSFLCVYMFLFI
jgi:hypothetical protein